jgi:hypothetical protein
MHFLEVMVHEGAEATFLFQNTLLEAEASLPWALTS